MVKNKIQNNNVERKKSVLDREKLKGKHYLESPFERKWGGALPGGRPWGEGGATAERAPDSC